MQKDPEQDTLSGKTGAQSSQDLTGSKNSPNVAGVAATTVPDKPDFALCIRTLKVSSLISLVAVLLLCISGHTNWAWGFLIGALLSLFSFATLAMAVPFLMWPGAPSHMSALLQVTLIMKLPIYCVGLYLACNLPGVTAAASVFGICLVPAVITLRAISGMVRATIRARFSVRTAVSTEPGSGSEAQNSDFSNDTSISRTGATPVAPVTATRPDTVPVKMRPPIHTATTELAAE